MTISPNTRLRLQFLLRVVRKECQHLALTDRRLFVGAGALKSVAQIEADQDLAERVEAFVGRFCRLQDTLGDKLLPTLLVALGEKGASAMDNLDRAERLGWVRSSDDWSAMRNLRNQMVHEYVEDAAILMSALRTAHDFVPVLIATADKLVSEIQSRGWA